MKADENEMVFIEPLADGSTAIGVVRGFVGAPRASPNGDSSTLLVDIRCGPPSIRILPAEGDASG